LGALVVFAQLIRKGCVNKKEAATVVPSGETAKPSGSEAKFSKEETTRLLQEPNPLPNNMVQRSRAKYIPTGQ
jgi:hypothetical protein